MRPGVDPVPASMDPGCDGCCGGGGGGGAEDRGSRSAGNSPLCTLLPNDSAGAAGEPRTGERQRCPGDTPAPSVEQPSGERRGGDCCTPGAPSEGDCPFSELAAVGGEWNGRRAGRPAAGWPTPPRLFSLSARSCCVWGMTASSGGGTRPLSVVQPPPASALPVGGAASPRGGAAGAPPGAPSFPGDACLALSRVYAVRSS